MARKSRRPSRAGGRRLLLRRIVMAAMPVVAVALVLLPQSFTDEARVWAGPVFVPLQNLTRGWTLDLAEQIRDGAPVRPTGETGLQSQRDLLENALAEATVRLAEYDRQVEDLARLRKALDGLPCRLIPASLLAPEVGGGRAGGLLTKGLHSGVSRGGAVISRRLNRGTREAIQQGEPVLAAAGLVGVIDKVGPLTSTIRLLTDPRTSLMVQIVTRRDGQWRPGPEGVARGAGDGKTILIEGIPRTSDVQPGDFVVTSPSPEAALPPYLIVGRVARCDLQSTALFYSLKVQPRVSPAEARNVYVLSPELPGPDN